MANIKSAIKRVKTNEARNIQNNSVKTAMRTAVKRAESAIVNNDFDTAKKSYAEAASKLDKAAAKGLVHKNFAARNKARLVKKMNAMNA